jgi:hypothetical protein
MRDERCVERRYNAPRIASTAAIGIVNTTLHHEHGLLVMQLLGARLGSTALRDRAAASQDQARPLPLPLRAT